MKERDYINATNLAKVRMAMQIIQSMHRDEKIVKPEEMAVVWSGLDAFCARLEKAMNPRNWDKREDNRLAFPANPTGKI